MIAKVLVLCITFLSFATSKHVPLRDEYLKYLRKHEKPLDRLDDTHRLEAFKKQRSLLLNMRPALVLIMLGSMRWPTGCHMSYPAVIRRVQE